MKGLKAISPILVFVMIYLVTSIVVGDFYKMPITVAFMLSSIYAVALPSEENLSERIKRFSQGAASENMMLMLWIFILAGAFASSAKVMGSVDATVNVTLSILPSEMLMPALFLAACFISISVGTSVGTIVALTPIAAGVATSTGESVPLLTALIVGGAFFGDNLSFISDTTIVATQTQGCRMSDKFRTNLFIALPAALLTLVYYFIIGKSQENITTVENLDYLEMLPYVVVLVSAAFGTNVLIVLTMGIVLTGLIGILDGSYDTFGWLQSMGDGIAGMSELIIITMMAGGMLEIIRKNGGIEWIINLLTRRVNGKKGAYASIAALVSMCNICTANNTVAILTVGGISKKISDKYGLDSRKCASILDTFSCITQGILPYGAQLLMAAGLAQINPVSIIPNLYYQMALAAIAVFAIITGYPKRYS